jgi:hypothetical protein
MQRLPDRLRVAALALASLLIAGTARADESRDALAEVAKCAEIAEASARLACYDAAAARVKSALAAQAPVAEAPAKKSLLEWFGLARPDKPVTKTEDFGKPPQPAAPAELTEITATVAEFAKTARGKAIFILDNGQVWRQLDADGTEVQYATPGKPMKVTIETGFLGSYNLTIEGRNGLVKVRRLQ